MCHHNLDSARLRSEYIKHVADWDNALDLFLQTQGNLVNLTTREDGVNANARCNQPVVFGYFCRLECQGHLGIVDGIVDGIALCVLLFLLDIEKRTKGERV